MRTATITVLLLSFFCIGCTVINKKTEKKDIYKTSKKKRHNKKIEWTAKKGNVKQFEFVGVNVDLQFERVELKDVLALLMGTLEQNYIVVDELAGVVDVEIKGKFKRNEVIEIIKNILSSKNYKLVGDSNLYSVHSNENLSDVDILRLDDDRKNTYIYHLQYETSENLKELLLQVFPDISIKQNTKINVLVIDADSEEYKEVKKVIKKLDARPKQVLVEITLLQVTLNNSLKYGVEYFITQKNHSGGNVSLLPTAIPPGPANIIKDGIKAFTFQKDFDAFVTILRSVSDVKILSKPNLLVQDGETSKIQVGSDEPVRSSTTLSGAGLSQESIEYRSVGVLLEVKVDIEESNVVKLKLIQELSTIVKSPEDTSIDSPSFRTNKVEITTLINDGENIYIGGLIASNKEKQIKKIPLLGDIPFIGRIFKSEDTTESKTELILLISVDIIFNKIDSDRIKFKYTR